MPQTLKVKLDLRADADFRLVVPTRRKQVIAGTAAVYTVQSTALGTYPDEVDLSVTGLPTGSAGTFAFDPIGSSASTTVSVGTTGVTGGTYEFLIGGDVYTPPGNVFAADSPELADVQAAIAAASPGDTVRVPAGSATWAYQLVITKGILLMGAGIGNTVITSNYAGGYGDSDSNFLIVYKPSDPAANDPFRLAGFEFDMGAHSSFLKLSNWSYTNIITKVRIDHNKVYGIDNGGNWPYVIYNYGNCYGVADNNDFSGGYFRWFGMDANWTYLTFDFGTADNFYVEDNVISVPGWSNIAYAERGARYCFRDNVVSNASTTMPMFFDMHGNQAASGLGTMGAEVYDNILNCSPAANGQLNDQRGGKALFYNNTINATGSAWPKIREDYLDSDNPPANNVISGQPQHPSDSYYWNNLTNGTTEIGLYISSTMYYSGLGRNVPLEDVDVWGQKTPFTGASGIGVGLLSARPSSGLAVGVGYWATDTQTLYRSTGATTWAAYYTAYAYPHPHRSDPILGD
jgi:hypothetical protein